MDCVSVIVLSSRSPDPDAAKSIGNRRQILYERLKRGHEGWVGPRVQEVLRPLGYGEPLELARELRTRARAPSPGHLACLLWAAIVLYEHIEPSSILGYRAGGIPVEQ